NADRLPEINDSLRHVKHLLLQDALGLRPFHSSLLVFVEGASDHQFYAKALRERTLNWLRTGAPDYWRWAYEWMIEADLGNKDILLKGPNRRWAVDSLAKGFSVAEASNILARSSWISLQSGDLGRSIETALLRDYL